MAWEFVEDQMPVKRAANPANAPTYSDAAFIEGAERD
jgi:hypothetical protein